jgi:cation diffusion facilitator family transporter
MAIDCRLPFDARLESLIHLSAPASPAPLYRAVFRAALAGLVINLALGIVKLVAGTVWNTFALVADAVNSLGDAITTLVVLYAIRVAQAPADEEHPYGHTRAEAVAASNVAILLIVSALLVGWEAIERLNVPHEIPPAITLWIAGANIVIKEGLYRYKVGVGRRTGSAAIIANAWDHRSDALCSLAVLIGLAVIRWGGQAFIWADEVASLCVVGAILWTGARLFHHSSSELLDVQAEPELVERIRAAASDMPGVRAIEKLLVRKSGLEYFADIHIQVDGQMTVDHGHRIGHEVKDRLLAEFAELRDVLVHLEPFRICNRMAEERRLAIAGSQASGRLVNTVPLFA